MSFSPDTSIQFVLFFALLRERGREGEGREEGREREDSRKIEEERGKEGEGGRGRKRKAGGEREEEREIEEERGKKGGERESQPQLLTNIITTNCHVQYVHM